MATSKPALGSERASVNPGLAELSLRAVKWNYLGLVVRIVAQLVAQIVLARLLGPESFGLFAAAFLVVSAGSILAELGLGSGLVQKKHLSDSEVRFAFTWLLIAGMAMTCLTYVSADVVAVFFEDDRVAGVLCGLAPVFVLQSLGIVPLSLLRRDMEFKTIQIVQVVSYVVGYMGVGIGFALSGAGVWSLVAAWAGQAGLASLMFLLARRHAMAPLIRSKDEGFRKFSLRVLLTNMVNWVIENVDNLIVGKVFGPAALGLYSVSYNLVRTPANHLVVTLQSVLFPASARAQDNPAGLRKAYLTVASGVALVAFPVFGGIAMVTDTMTVALFGLQWRDAGDILLPLALSMTLHAVMAVAGPVLWGKGAAGTELRVQLFVGVAFVVTLLVAARYSVAAMAWAVCGVYGLRAAGMTVALMRHIDLPGVALWNALRGGLLAALLVGMALLAAEIALVAWHPLPRLGVEIALAGLVLMVFVLGAPTHALSGELRELVLRLLTGTSLGRSRLAQRIKVGVAKP